jgi:hypothetical protein
MRSRSSRSSLHTFLVQSLREGWIASLVGIVLTGCTTTPPSPHVTMRGWVEALPGPRLTWNELVRAVNAECDAEEAEIEEFKKSHEGVSSDYKFKRHEIGDPKETLGGVRMVVVYRIHESGATGNGSCDQYFETSTGWAGPYRTCGLNADEGPQECLGDGTPVWSQWMHQGGSEYSDAYVVLDRDGKWNCLVKWFFWTEGEGHDFHFFRNAALTDVKPTPAFLGFIRHPITQTWLRQQDFLTQWCCLRLEPSGCRIMAAVEYENNLPANEKRESSRARLWSYDLGVGYVLLEEHWVKPEDAKQWAKWLSESDDHKRSMTEADWRWLTSRAEKESK